MIKIFYIVNGSNDLFSPLSQNFKELKEIFLEKENIEVYCLYKLIKSDPLNIWKKIGEEEDEEGAFKYFKGKFEEIDIFKYYEIEIIEKREVKYLNIKKFLNDYLNESDYNVVMISGHGGPFQALLDLNVSPGISINTLELIKGINEFSIKLLFLDMCAMNYVEIIYEILYKNKVEKVITYKNFAPFEGIDYRQFIEYLEKKNYKAEFKELKGPLVYIDTSMINEIEQLRREMNLLIINGIEKKERKFQNDIEEFRKKRVSIGIETKEKALGNTFNYIKYFLNNRIEREIYGEYKFSENNLWSIVTRRELKRSDYSQNRVIPIQKDGIINIIDIHSNIVNEIKLNELFFEFIKIRNEEDIYFKK